jgi:hypothetical protein
MGGEKIDVGLNEAAGDCLDLVPRHLLQRIMLVEGMSSCAETMPTETRLAAKAKTSLDANFMTFPFW